MSFLFSAITRLLIQNHREKGRDTTRAQSIDAVPPYLQSIPSDQPADDEPLKSSIKPSISCPLYPQPQPRAYVKTATPDAPVSPHPTGEDSKQNDGNETTDDSSDNDAQPNRLTAACVTAVNRALANGRTTQVVYFGLGENVMQFLQSPAAPPVTLYLVDHVSHESSTVSPKKSKSSPALKYPLLPNDVRVVRVRTDLQLDAWDSHVVQAGYDWQQRSAWVVNLDISVSHFSSAHVLDTFLRMVHNLTTPLSTIIITYSTQSDFGSDPETGTGDKLNENVSSKDGCVPLKFTPSTFSQFVRQRRFRVLCDNTIEADQGLSDSEDEKENKKCGDKDWERVRIATLIHGNTRTSTRSTSLDVVHDLGEPRDDLFDEEYLEEWWNMGEVQTSSQQPAKEQPAGSEKSDDKRADLEDSKATGEPKDSVDASATKDDSTKKTMVGEEETEKNEHVSHSNGDDGIELVNEKNENKHEAVLESKPGIESTGQPDQQQDSGTGVGEQSRAQSHEKPQETQADVQGDLYANEPESVNERPESNNIVVEFGLRTESLEGERTEGVVGAVVIGSIAAVGEWDADHAVKMDGDFGNSEGCLQATVHVTKDVEVFEYKYALVDSEGNIVKWEEGSNRIVHVGGEQCEGGDNGGSEEGKGVVVRDESWRHGMI